MSGIGLAGKPDRTRGRPSVGPRKETNQDGSFLVLERRGIRASLSVALLMVLTVLLSPPANAATWTCGSWQDKSFSTSGYNTDVEIRLCITRYTTAHQGFAQIRWTDGGEWVKKFDNFDVRIRLERWDADYDKVSCSFESDINLYESDSDECGYVYSSSSRSGGWSVDGYVAFDLDADGEGGYKWSLHGSPLIN
jgi:hypothetical protein